MNKNKFLESLSVIKQSTLKEIAIDHAINADDYANQGKLKIIQKIEKLAEKYL